MILTSAIRVFFSSEGKGDRFLKAWWWILLPFFAMLYYGQYYRAGLYPAAEGGLEGVVALRLMEGQRPIVDTFLGYNLLWFYPVVWLFKIFGPSYTALRLFFLTLCTVTGLVAFRVVLKTTGKAWAAFLTGILVLVIPGQMFRNYMAFVAVANMSLFLSAYVLPSGVFRRLLWMTACGIMLGITFLIRIDVGVFLSVVLLGLAVMFPLVPWCGPSLGKRFLIALAGLALTFLGLFATHLPVYLDARHRGFSSEFTGQYRQWPDMIRVQGVRMAGIASRMLSSTLYRGDTPSVLLSRAGRGGAPVGAAVVHTTPSAESAKISSEALERRPLFSGNARDRMLALNIYLPVLIGLMIGAGGLAALSLALLSRDEGGGSRGLIVLTCLGCSAALFPQYFFWRPDMVHLSEFMVPMTVTMIVSALLVAGASKASTPGFWKACGLFSNVLISVTLVLYYINACQSQSSGGIATLQKKNMEFRAANGVRVKLTPSEFRTASAIQEIVGAVSSPGEYLICYPYNPEINFMTDRPSYEYNLYADNGIPAERFHRETVARIERYHPVAFVITDWEVNNTKESRFSNWASPTYRYIGAKYVKAYQSGNVEVYVRPDRAGRIPEKFRVDAATGAIP